MCKETPKENSTLLGWTLDLKGYLIDIILMSVHIIDSLWLQIVRVKISTTLWITLFLKPSL